jgi:hypothetical protein
MNSVPNIRAIGPAYIAIPAKDEAGDIEACLRALACQTGLPPGPPWLRGAVLCLNNCTDDSADVARRLADNLPFAVHVIEVELPRSQAYAGTARRMAMDRAAAFAGEDGVILTSDADSRVAPDWLSRNLAALRHGADAVAGRAEIEPQGAALIPAHLHAIDARECAYAALLDEIRSILDPDPADPWPRHDEHSGASIAVTVQAYRRAGGMPAVRLGEDRAFFEALRRIDARIRHDPSVRVVVSARLEGRAQGGMADTIRRRMTAMDPFLDERLEHVADAMRRARARAALRHALSGDAAARARLTRILRVPRLDIAPGGDGLGAIWTALETASPALVRRPVALTGLDRETARARRALAALRSRAIAATRPAGIDLAEAAD